MDIEVIGPDKETEDAVMEKISKYMNQAVSDSIPLTYKGHLVRLAFSEDSLELQIDGMPIAFIDIHQANDQDDDADGIQITTCGAYIPRGE